MKEQKADILRILVVDDEPAILDAYEQVLRPETYFQQSGQELEALSTKLFGEDLPQDLDVSFDLVPCRQAKEAVEAARLALDQEAPFAVAFIDVRLPPGKDGIWTAEQIRLSDPDMNIVMVTAYSDVDPLEIGRRVLPEDKLLYVQKPFYPQEIRQFAIALGAKWRAERALREVNERLEEQVRERTAELKKSNRQLREEITEHIKTENTLRKRETELELKSRRLEEVNTALKVLLRQRDEHKAELEEKVLANLKELVIPYIQNLKGSNLDAKQLGYVSVLESNLDDLISPFSHKLSTKHLSLTTKEIQVANLVKEGRTTDEIAKLLGVSSNAIVFHRYNIRKKLGLNNQKVNLRSYLLSLP